MEADRGPRMMNAFDSPTPRFNILYCYDWGPGVTTGRVETKEGVYYNRPSSRLVDRGINVSDWMTI